MYAYLITFLITDKASKAYPDFSTDSFATEATKA